MASKVIVLAQGEFVGCGSIFGRWSDFRRLWVSVAELPPSPIYFILLIMMSSFMENAKPIPDGDWLILALFP